MDSSQYFALELAGVSQSLEDILTGQLFEIGAVGVQENLQFTQMDRQYKPQVVETEIKDLVAYFEKAPDADSLRQISLDYPEIQMRLNQHPIKDWLSEWKKQWKPFELCKDCWVVPEWEKENFDEDGKQVLFIEPGMAFGTGTHETTQIASQLLIEAIEAHEIDSLMDVGTGSGILALLAGLRGVSKIYGYDNDSESERVFLENREKNQQPALIWEPQWEEALVGKITLTLANIIDGVLLDLKPSFQAMKSPYYIFTGVLLEREQSFLEKMQEGWNLNLLKRIEKGDWVGFLFEAQP